MQDNPREGELDPAVDDCRHGCKKNSLPIILISEQKKAATVAAKSG